MLRTMRRFKQLLPAEEVERILRNGKYCVWRFQAMTAIHTLFL